MIDSSFRFHPVGQGLFYSGHIGNFTFVYDCGTKNQRSLHLDPYIEQTSKYFKRIKEIYHLKKMCHEHNTAPTLDLLVVSHFHKDHIKGIKELLEKTGGVKQIIVPYLHPVEKLLLLTEYMHEDNNDNSDNSDFLNALYLQRDFWRDAKITELNDPEINKRRYPAPDERNTTSEEIPSLFKWSVKRGENNNVMPRPHSDEYLSSLWKFRFYCNSIDEAKLEKIRKELDQDESHQKINLNVSPKRILYDIRNRYAEIEKAYKEMFNTEEMNPTSLVCYHGPKYNDLFSNMDVWARLRNVFTSFRGENLLSGQMLTGDIKFEWDEKEKNIPDNFLNHYANELPKIGLCSIPHHGAAGNWSKDFFEKMNNCQNWVCSFGLGNEHKHPGLSVIDSFHENCKLFTECNQLQSVNIKVYPR